MLLVKIMACVAVISAVIILLYGATGGGNRP